MLEKCVINNRVTSNVHFYFTIITAEVTICIGVIYIMGDNSVICMRCYS
jgi:hypothetical protein